MVRDLQLRIGVNPDYPVWNDLEVNLATARVPATGGPTWTKITDDDAGSTGVYGWGFGASGDENLFFAKQITHDWTRGTDLEPHIHYCPGTAASGNVVWELEYTLAPIGQPFPNSTLLQVTADAHRLAVNAGAALDHALVGWDPDISPPTDLLEAGVSGIIIGRIARLGSDAADTYAGTVIGLSVDFHYQLDGLGSGSTVAKDESFPAR